MSGNTNSKIRNQNKQIKKQNKYDKAMWRYSWETSLDNYERSMQLRQLNVANANAAADYRDSVQRDQYRYGRQMQRQEFQDRSNAYNRSVTDYYRQRGLNEMAAQRGFESARRTRDEALIGAVFGRRRDSLGYRQTRAENRFALNQGEARLTTAIVDRNLRTDAVETQQRGASRIQQQQQANFRTQDQQLRADLGTLARTDASQRAMYGRDQEILTAQRDNLSDNRGRIARDIARENQSLLQQRRINTEQQDSVDLEIAQLGRQDQQLQDQLGFQLDSINLQDQQLVDQQGFSLNQIRRSYEQTKAETLSNKMEQQAENLRQRGQLAARGVRGQTADSLEQSALASYGRQQAKQVQDMVFASGQMDNESDALRSRTAFQRAGLNIERNQARSRTAFQRSAVATQRAQQVNRKDVLGAERQLNELRSQGVQDASRTQRRTLFRDMQNVTRQKGNRRSQEAIRQNNVRSDRGKLTRQRVSNQRAANISSYGYQRDTMLRNNQKSQLEAALDATRVEVDLANQNIRNRMGFQAEEWRLNSDIYRANRESIQRAYTSNKNQIKIDQYQANLSARGRVMQRPRIPPALPIPRATPRTQFLEPARPQRPPKPIKGALGKTSVWNDVGDVFNAGLQIASIF